MQRKPQPGAVTLSNPPLPPCRLLAGEEPLVRVRLTRLGDGDILAITLAHIVTGAASFGLCCCRVCVHVHIFAPQPVDISFQSLRCP